MSLYERLQRHPGAIAAPLNLHDDECDAVVDLADRADLVLFLVQHPEYDPGEFMEALAKLRDALARLR